MKGYQIGKYGWDGPVEAKITLIKEDLIRSFADAAPVGAHEHDRISHAYRAPKRSRTGRARTTEFPRKGGRLRKLLNNEGIGKWNVFFTSKGSFHRASISLFSAYARIQDEGGYVPPTHAANLAMVMAWHSGGKDVFAKYRAGFHVPAKNYIAAGFHLFMDRTGLGGGMKVGWI